MYFVLNVCLLFTLTNLLLVYAAAGDKTCGQVADIVFIIDASRSIWPPHFREELYFVGNITSSFDIGPKKTQIAAVTFSKGYNKEFLLNKFTDKSSVIEAIKNITFTQGGVTDTGEALKFAREAVFKPQNGSRPNVPKIMIVTTDGKSRNTALTASEAKKAREMGIVIFAVGVGAAQETELSSIASPPSDEFVVIEKDFSKLKNIQQLLAFRACKATITTTPKPTTTTTTTPKPTTTTTPKPTTTTPTPTTTKEPMQGDKPDGDCITGDNSDVIFVLDKSSSIDNKDFAKQLDFVADVISSFNIGPKKTQIGVVTFSDTPNVEFYLNTYKKKKEIKNAVRRIRYTGGNTYTNLALEVVRDEMLSQVFGARPGVAKIVVVITDGVSRLQKYTADVAQEIKKRKVFMFAIGVGKAFDIGELKSIASSPQSKFVQTVNGYNALEEIKDILSIKSCTDKPNDIPATCGSRDPADVLFVADDTGNTRLLNMIGNVAGGLDVSRKKIHVGLEAGGCLSSINLMQHYNKYSFAKALIPASDRFSTLLAKAKQSLTGPFSRSNAKRVMVVYISGEIKDINKVKREIIKIVRHKSKIRVIFVAGTEDADTTLKGLANKMNIYPSQIVSYQDVGQGQSLLNRICDALKIPK